MTCFIEDLGVAGVGEAILEAHKGIIACHPQTGAEYALLPTMEHGFVAVQPHTGIGIHVRPNLDQHERTSRSMAQGPDGNLYMIGFRSGQCYAKNRAWSLLRWDWNPEGAPQAVVDGVEPIDPVLRLEFDACGRLHVLNRGRLFRLDVRTGGTAPVGGPYLAALSSARDHRLYLQNGNGIDSLDPQTDRALPVQLPDSVDPAGVILQKDGGGRTIGTCASCLWTPTTAGRWPRNP
ncbi:MAG: hypothetical protein HYU36_23575 [Planctomycetes bacterium]|nr:hypothetical protein [Planctomycetota bacterium]